MKKIFALAAMLLIGMSAFAGEAWKNHLGYGWRVPTGITLSETQKNSDWELKMPVQTGLDVTYTGVHMDSGFSVRAFMDYNISSSNIQPINPNDDYNLYGFNFDVAMGAGWAPVRNKFFLLGFYGILGFDMTHLLDSDASVKIGNGSAITTEVISYGSFFAGGNATLAWTPFGGKFSFYGSATACYNFPGIVNSELETKYEPMDGSEASTTKYSDMKKVFGTVRIIPAVGISWRF
jgi:hypothetical protein